MHDMPDPDQQELDALDAALDAIALGTPRASALTEFALEQETASTIDRFWADASRPGTSVPDSTFVARLREDLMQTSPSIPIASPVTPDRRRHRHLMVPVPQVPRMKSAFGALSTAAAIVLVVALVIISFTGSGRGIPTTVLNSLSLGPTSQENGNQEIMWGGDAGRSWNLSNDDPTFGDAARLLASVSNVQVISALIVGDDLILTGVDSTSATGDMFITLINLHTDEARWRIPLRTWGNMASDGEHIFVLTLDPTEKTNPKPRLTAISLETGDAAWTGPDLLQVSDSPFGYGPILLGGMLYASDTSGNTVAVDPKTGEQQWQYPQAFVPTAQSDIRDDDLVQSNMIGIGDTIYIVTTSRTLVKLDRRTGKELLTMNLLDRFGSDVRSISLQASGSDLLVNMTRPLDEESNDRQRLDGIPGTLARVRASDFFIEWQSVTNASEGNRVSQENVMMTSSGKSPSGPFFLNASDPTEKAGRVLLVDDPEDLSNVTGNSVFALVSGAGNTVISYGEGNTVTFFPNAPLLFTPTPDTNTVTQLTTTSIHLPGEAETPVIPPLLWGNIPVVVTMGGTVWALDGNATETTIPAPPVGIQIALTDTGFSPDIIDIPAGTGPTFTLTLHNDGTRNHTFSIPQLGIDELLTAGESRDITVEARTGTYAVFSRLPGDLDAGMTAQLTIPSGNDSVSTGPGTILINPLAPRYSSNSPRPIMARPTDNSKALISLGLGPRVTGLSSIESDPSAPTVAEADGEQWILVVIETGEVGWMPLTDLDPVPPSADARAQNCPAIVLPVTPPLGSSEQLLKISGINRPAIQGWPALLPEEVPSDLGTPADMWTRMSATSSLDQIIRCAREEDDTRIQDLISDDYRQRLNDLPPTEGGRTALGNPSALVPLPASAIDEPSGITISQVNKLSDGRVLVVVKAEGIASPNPNGLISYIYIFTPGFDQLILDEAVPVATFSKDPDTASTPVAASPVATDDAVRYADALNPASITLRIQVDVDGILNEDATAVANAQNELNRVLAPYADGSSCKIGFALISTRSNELDSGIQVSDAIAAIIMKNFPELMPAGSNGSPGTLTSESIALPGSVPIGEVQMQLFLNNDCQPLESTPVAG